MSGGKSQADDGKGKDLRGEPNPNIFSTLASMTTLERIHFLAKMGCNL